MDNSINQLRIEKITLEARLANLPTNAPDYQYLRASLQGVRRKITAIADGTRHFSTLNF